MKQKLLGGGLCGVAALLLLAAPGHSGQGSTTPKEALQELNDFIGGWKGSGTSEKNKTEIWKENLSWSWRFKGQDAWLNIEFKDSKFYKSGEVRYLPEKRHYQMTLTDKAGQRQVFEGVLKKNRLTLERLIPDKKDVQQVVLHTAGEGVRFIWTFSVKPANRTQFVRAYQFGLTKEGENFAGGNANKKPECVVTGGLGTSTVSYKGVTYYVCCSGCRDAFNENPEKIIKEYEARKKKKN